MHFYVTTKTTIYRPRTVFKEAKLKEKSFMFGVLTILLFSLDYVLV